MTTLYTLTRTLRAHRFRFNNEGQLQIAVERVLAENMFRFQRELRLSEKDRIDFLVEDVGIEIKTNSTRTEVALQLHRYAQHDKINALILLTNRAKHLSMPATINGKELEVVFIGGLL